MSKDAVLTQQQFTDTTKILAEFFGTLFFTFVIGCSKGDHYIPIALFMSLLIVGSNQ